MPRQADTSNPKLLPKPNLATPEPERAFKLVRDPRKRAYLIAFAQTGQVGKSAEIAGVDNTTPWYWKRDDTDFREAFAVAEEMYAAALEDEISRRAVEGIEKPIYWRGEIAGHVREYSDLLLIFRTKGALPAKYADRLHIDIEARVREMARAMGIDPEEAVAEAQKLLGPGK